MLMNHSRELAERQRILAENHERLAGRKRELEERKQKLAEYHDATDGVDGCTVTGIPVPGVRGKPLPVLKGKGFSLSEDGKCYISDASGFVEYKDGRLEVHHVMTVNEVTASTGRIVFDGDLHVRENVTDGAYIEVTGDILIDGMVEKAVTEREIIKID